MALFAYKFSIKNRKVIYFLIICFIIFNVLNGQNDYKFHFDTLRNEKWKGLHSFAYGLTNDTLVIIGGRYDGIHEKESGFERNKVNDSIYIINIRNLNIESYPLPFINEDSYDALTAANTLFAQNQNYLYIMGGYGESITGGYKTFPSLIRLELHNLITNIKQGSLNKSLVHKIDSNYALTGGQMVFLDSLLYIVGGHKFSGKYHHNSGLVNQRYSDRASIYEVQNFASDFKLKKHKEIIDEFNFHRRDYNLGHIIDENSKLKLMIYSGVFLENEARPYFNIASLDYTGYQDINQFEQRFANYQCAKLALYNSKFKSMSEVFFGGMSEYYRDSTGSIGRDPFIPFVNHISSVSRDSNSNYNEYLFKDTLFSKLGTNAEFILNPDVKLVSENIIDYQQLTNDTNYLGFIIGGLWNPNTERNPWYRDKANTTLSNPYIIKTYIIPNSLSSSNLISIKNPFSFKLIHNRIKNYIHVSVTGDGIDQINYYCIDINGHIVLQDKISNSANEFQINTSKLSAGIYKIILSINRLYLLNKSFVIQAE